MIPRAPVSHSERWCPDTLCLRGSLLNSRPAPAVCLGCDALPSAVREEGQTTLQPHDQVRDWQGRKPAPGAAEKIVLRDGDRSPSFPLVEPTGVSGGLPALPVTAGSPGIVETLPPCQLRSARKASSCPAPTASPVLSTPVRTSPIPGA